MRLFLILPLLFFVVACGSNTLPSEDDQNETTKVDSLEQLKATEKALEKAAADSIRKNQELMAAYERFTSSPLVRYDNFSFKTGFLPIDKIKAEFDKDPKMNASYRKDIERGDCGYCIKSMSKNQNETLHYIKGDCGEYGFSNDQYYLQNDSLKLIRGFFVGINTWPSESEESTWRVKETIHIFSKDKVLIKQRELIVSDFVTSDSLIRKKPFTEKTVSLESVYEEQKKEMIESLEMKTAE